MFAVSILDIPKLAAAGALGFAAAYLLSVAVWQPQARQEAIAAERTAILARTTQVIKDRNKTDAEISNMDAAALCRALGGVPDKGTCN